MQVCLLCRRVFCAGVYFVQVCILCRRVFLATEVVCAGVRYSVDGGLCVFSLPAPVFPRRNHDREGCRRGQEAGKRPLPFALLLVLGRGAGGTLHGEL